MAKPEILASSILDALPSELSRGLFAQGRSLSLDADQTLFLAGDEGDGCYRVEEGLLKASVAAPNGGERILAILGPGSVVGELSMIDGGPRSASVIALRDAKLCYVSKADFEAIGKSSPEIYRHVMRMLARRLRDTNNALAASSFLSVRARGAGTAEPGRGVRQGRWQRAHSHSAKGQPERSGGNGRHRSRKCEPRAPGLERPWNGEPACRLLLPREEGGDPAPGRAVMFTAWMKWDQRLWREHDRRRERMLRHAQ